MSAAHTPELPASSTDDHISGWSADFDVDPYAFREAVVLWTLLAIAFVCTIAWLGFSAGMLVVRLGLV